MYNKNIPAALSSRTEAGGVFNMKVKLLSCKHNHKHNNIIIRRKSKEKMKKKKKRIRGLLVRLHQKQ